MSNISPEVEALVHNLIAAIETDVARRLHGVLASALGAAASAAVSRQPAGKSWPVVRPLRRPVSPELAQARRLQGQYLGALRGLKPADHARVKALAHEKGLPAAIKLAHSIRR